MNTTKQNNELRIRQNIIEHLEIAEKALAEGRIFTQQQVEHRLAKWLLNSNSKVSTDTES